MILLKDGVRYTLWTSKEEKELEEMVKDYAKETFGEGTIYLMTIRLTHHV